MNDWELLEQFRRDCSQDAFAEIVNRHIGLVYGSCRRRLRDAQLAEDVTQAVFLLLAQRGPKDRSRSPSLAPWLVTAAGYACANAARSRAVQQRHEKLAASERHEVQTTTEPSGDLDDAMQRGLSASDREVVLLRYYENREVQEIGTILGIAPNSAAKRLSRAVERLRKFLSGRGMDLSSVALTQQIVQTMQATAPTGLAAKISAVAVGQLAAPAAAQQFAQGVIQMIRYTQIKLATLTAAAVVVLSTGAIVAMTQQSGEQKSVVSMSAPATNPAAAESKKLKAATPKESLLSLAFAMRNGDAESLRALTYAKDAPEQRLLDAACQYVSASMKFRKSVATKFGKPVAVKMFAPGAGFPSSPLDNFAEMVEKHVPNAEVQMDGETAIVPCGDQVEDKLYVLKVGDMWKIDCGKMIATWSQEQYQQRATGVEQFAAVLDELATQVEAGKFATPQDLGQALQQMFGQGR